MKISIHAPRTGSDRAVPGDVQRAGGISIHAPRTGSDEMPSSSIWAMPLFQSTLPARGATRTACCACAQTRHFNPRSPHGERRLLLRLLQNALPISIHAPRTGSDSRPASPSCKATNFNPRSPHGERLPCYAGDSVLI